MQTGSFIGKTYCHTTAEEWSSLGAINLIRDRDDKVAVGTVVRSVTAHGLSSVWPVPAVGVGGLDTVVLVTGLAGIALEARTTLGTNCIALIRRALRKD